VQHVAVVSRRAPTDGAVHRETSIFSLSVPSLTAGLADARIWVSATLKVVQTGFIELGGCLFRHTNVADFRGTPEPPVHILFYMKILVWGGISVA
jgi:hypothetical protein